MSPNRPPLLKSPAACLTWAGAALLLLSSPLALAQGQPGAKLRLPDLAQVDQGPAPSLPQAVVVRPRPVKFVVGIGMTGGGDRLATAEVYRSYYGYYGFDEYDERNIRAGQLVQLHAGIEWRVAPAVTMQALIGTHTDGASGWNGAIDFDRYPLELLGHFEFAPRWRAGGGLRYVFKNRLDGKGSMRDYDIKFKNSLGPVVEVEFLPLPWMGVKLRGVVERYKPRVGGESYNGNHVGIFANFYF